MTPRTKREYLRELVADKNRWSCLQLNDAECALGFLGWHECGYLPLTQRGVVCAPSRAKSLRYYRFKSKGCFVILKS